MTSLLSSWDNPSSGKQHFQIISKVATLNIFRSQFDISRRSILLPSLSPPSVQWHYSSLQVTNIYRKKIFDSHLQRVSSLLQPPSSVHELRNIESLSPRTTFQHSTVLLTHPLTTCSTHHLIYNSHKQFSRPWFISKAGIGILFCVVGGFSCQLVCPGEGLVMAAGDVADWVVWYTFMVGWLQYNIANPAH